MNKIALKLKGLELYQTRSSCSGIYLTSKDEEELFTQAEQDFFEFLFNLNKTINPQIEIWKKDFNIKETIIGENGRIKDKFKRMLSQSELKKIEKKGITQLSIEKSKKLHILKQDKELEKAFFGLEENIDNCEYYINKSRLVELSRINFYKKITSGLIVKRKDFEDFKNNKYNCLPIKLLGDISLARIKNCYLYIFIEKKHASIYDNNKAHILRCKLPEDFNIDNKNQHITVKNCSLVLPKTKKAIEQKNLREVYVELNVTEKTKKILKSKKNKRKIEGKKKHKELISALTKGHISCNISEGILYFGLINNQGCYSNITSLVDNKKELSKKLKTFFETRKQIINLNKKKNKHSSLGYVNENQLNDFNLKLKNLDLRLKSLMRKIATTLVDYAQKNCYTVVVHNYSVNYTKNKNDVINNDVASANNQKNILDNILLENILESLNSIIISKARNKKVRMSCVSRAGLTRTCFHCGEMMKNKRNKIFTCKSCKKNSKYHENVTKELAIRGRNSSIQSTRSNTDFNKTKRLTPLQRVNQSKEARKKLGEKVSSNNNLIVREKTRKKTSFKKQVMKDFISHEKPVLSEPVSSCNGVNRYGSHSKHKYYAVSEEPIYLLDSELETAFRIAEEKKLTKDKKSFVKRLRKEITRVNEHYENNKKFEKCIDSYSLNTKKLEKTALERLIIELALSIVARKQKHF